MIRPKQFLNFYGPLLAFTVCQLLFFAGSNKIRPELGIVPPVPGKEELAVLKFGDDEFYFRVLALQLQNTGDTYGRFSSLKLYDMERVYHWLTLMDTLDSRSDMMPAMAAYYFSQTQKTEDVRYLANYLYEHSIKDVGRKWWWLLQDIYLAQYKLKDMDLALKVSKPLLNKDVPVWAQQMAAVVREKRGEMEDALKIMESIKDNAEAIPERDLKYMLYFVEERLNRLDKVKEFKAIKPGEEKPTFKPNLDE